MIVDTSAIIAILFNEPERQDFIETLIDSAESRLSAGTWIELAAVLTRRDDDRTEALYALVSEFAIRIEPVGVEQGLIGHDAYRTYGRGTRSKAKLNLGDCFAYALAKATSQPLLFKGNDFTHTDIVAALPL